MLVFFYKTYQVIMKSLQQSWFLGFHLNNLWNLKVKKHAENVNAITMMWNFPFKVWSDTQSWIQKLREYTLENRTDWGKTHKHDRDNGK